MPFALRFEIEGEAELSRRFMKLSEGVKNFAPAFSETEAYMKKTFSRDVFETEGGVIGESWKPLTSAYAARKMKKYPGKGLLEATGTMKNSFATFSNMSSAAIWNTADYFKYHQSKAARSKLPRRAMMKLDIEQKSVITKIFRSYLTKIQNGTAI